MSNYYTAIIFLNIFALVIMQLCISSSTTLNKKKKKIFYALFNAIITAAFCEWFGNYLQSIGAATRILHITVKILELSIAPSIGFFVVWNIEKRDEKIIYIYLTVHAILEVASGIGGFIFCVDENSRYIHGDFYWIYVLAYTISIIYGIYIVVRNFERYQYSGGEYFLLMVIFMVSGIVIQMNDSRLKVDYVVTGMAAIMMYVLTLEMIYQTDEVTELVNRRGFDNYISDIEDKCIVLFFDVDFFKQINDTYGHAYGDTVLKCVGKEIRKHYAKYGKCFRYGGDEFCVTMIKNLNHLEKINQQFLKSISKQREADPRIPSISIGYAYYDRNYQSIQDTIREADLMMYKNKEINRNVTF